MFELTPAMEYELDRMITEATNRWEENRNSRNELIGEDRAQQELAFRDAIVSKKSEKIGNSEKFFWITVNPRTADDAYPLSEFVKTIAKMYKKKWILSYMYVFENTVGGHFHSHGLIRAKYESARARRELANSVKNCCLITNSHCFKFVELKNEEEARTKISYMLGIKQDKKKPDVALTIDWRVAESLQPFYQSEVPPILLGPREGISIAEVSENSDTNVLPSDMDTDETELIVDI